MERKLYNYIMMPAMILDHGFWSIAYSQYRLLCFWRIMDANKVNCGRNYDLLSFQFRKVLK